jgi:fructokinase
MKMVNILSYLNDHAISTDLIQVTNENKRESPCDDKWKGNASYDILYPSVLEQNWKTERMVKLIAEADVLLWSLASRDEVSWKPYFLLDKAKYKVLM